MAHPAVRRPCLPLLAALLILAPGLGGGYAEAQPSDSAALLGDWRFDEGRGDVVADRSIAVRGAEGQ